MEVQLMVFAVTLHLKFRQMIQLIQTVNVIMIIEFVYHAIQVGN